MDSGGGSRIRTHEGLAPLTVFKTAAFNHSAIPPRSKNILKVKVGVQFFYDGKVGVQFF